VITGFHTGDVDCANALRTLASLWPMFRAQMAENRPLPDVWPNYFVAAARITVGSACYTCLV
jgi:hypothetical protein